MSESNAQMVHRWITQYRGEEVANIWLWECTPFPCGEPSKEQLDRGLDVALGTMTIGELVAQVEAEMEMALEAYAVREVKE